MDDGFQDGVFPSPHSQPRLLVTLAEEPRVRRQAQSRTVRAHGPRAGLTIAGQAGRERGQELEASSGRSAALGG